MSEPMIFKITNQSAWDGTTLVDITREAFQQEGRLYTTTIEQGGLLLGDFFGLFSGSAPKLVAIAVDSYDPRVRAHVTPNNDSDHYRQVVDLTPVYQSVFMTGTDVLRVRSTGPGLLWAGSRKVTLVVNELSEAEAVRCVAGSLNTKQRMRRARILRSDDQPFLIHPQKLLTTGFTYDLNSGYLEATVANQGWVSVQDLVDPGSEGVYVWVRFTGLGIGTGEVHRFDDRTDESLAVAVGLKCLEWSTPIWLSRDDRLCFQTAGSAGDAPLAVDLEVSHVSQRRV